MSETLIRLTDTQRALLADFLAGPCFYMDDTLHAAGLLGRGLLRLRSRSPARRGARGWYEITPAGRAGIAGGSR